MKRWFILFVALLSGCATMTDEERQRLRVALGAAAIAVSAYSVARYGTGGYYGGEVVDWDEFYDANGILVWQCRNVQNGQFVDNIKCSGLPQTDARWPSKRAW